MWQKEYFHHAKWLKQHSQFNLKTLNFLPKISKIPLVAQLLVVQLCMNEWRVSCIFYQYKD